jgi:hypothetical protein
MKFVIGENRIEFNKDFKPKSLTLFLQTYSLLGSEEELIDIYDTLNGNAKGTSTKIGKADGNGSGETNVQGDKRSGKRNSKSK